MDPCAVCEVAPGIRVEVRATKGSARAVLCMPCHEGVVLEARLRAHSCNGCRSLASAFDQADALERWPPERPGSRFPSHVSGCLGLGYRLHRTVPRPFAGWPQRRAWLVRAKMVREMLTGASAMPPRCCLPTEMNGWSGP